MHHLSRRYTYKTLRLNPSHDACEKLLTCCRERAEYKDVTMIEFVDRVKQFDATNLISKNTKYHKECYFSHANTNKLQRCRNSYETFLSTKKSTDLQKGVGRPSSSKNQKELREKQVFTRSRTEPYDKLLSIICQKPGGKLHLVQTKETGDLMLSTSEKLEDKNFFCRLLLVPMP